jgi:UDP-N-acetylmuramyl pentapeptide synthase
MKINRVEVTYGELRSTGYPTFSNKRHELTLGATLEAGESARAVHAKLSELAKREVRKAFGDNVDQSELDLPF